MVDAADATDIQARPLQLHNVEVEVLARAIDSVTNERGRESDPRKVVDVQVDSGEFEVELSMVRYASTQNVSTRTYTSATRLPSGLRYEMTIRSSGATHALHKVEGFRWERNLSADDRDAACRAVDRYQGAFGNACRCLDH